VSKNICQIKKYNKRLTKISNYLLVRELIPCGGDTATGRKINTAVPTLFNLVYVCVFLRQVMFAQ